MNKKTLHFTVCRRRLIKKGTVAIELRYLSKFRYIYQQNCVELKTLVKCSHSVYSQSHFLCPYSFRPFLIRSSCKRFHEVSELRNDVVYFMMLINKKSLHFFYLYFKIQEKGRLYEQILPMNACDPAIIKMMKCGNFILKKQG